MNKKLISAALLGTSFLGGLAGIKPAEKAINESLDHIQFSTQDRIVSAAKQFCEDGSRKGYVYNGEKQDILSASVLTKNELLGGPEIANKDLKFQDRLVGALKEIMPPDKFAVGCKADGSIEIKSVGGKGMVFVGSGGSLMKKHHPDHQTTYNVGKNGNVTRGRT